MSPYYQPVIVPRVMGSFNIPGSTFAPRDYCEHNNMLFFAGTVGRMIRMRRDGMMFSVTTPNNQQINSVYSTGSRLFIAIENTGVYYSDDDGTTWTQSTGLPVGGDAECIRSDFNGTVIATVSGTGNNIYRSTNNGVSFNTVAVTSAPDDEHQSIYWDDKTSQFFVMTATSILRSSDGLIWTSTVSPATFPSTIIRFNGTLYLGTENNRIYSVNDTLTAAIEIPNPLNSSPATYARFKTLFVYAGELYTVAEVTGFMCIMQLKRDVFAQILTCMTATPSAIRSIGIGFNDKIFSSVSVYLFEIPV